MLARKQSKWDTYALLLVRKLVRLLWRTVWNDLRKLHVCSCGPDIPLLSVYSGAATARVPPGDTHSRHCF